MYFKNYNSQKEQGFRQSSNKSLTQPPSRPQPIFDSSSCRTPVILPASNGQVFTIEDIDRILAERDRANELRIVQLEQTISGLQLTSEIANPKFIYTSPAGVAVNLIKDVVGKDAKTWAAHCFNIIFTKEEMSAATLNPSDISPRGHLSPQRVKLIKEAFEHKYQGMNKDKQDGIWFKLNKRINNKGRLINYFSAPNVARRALNLTKTRRQE
jgi:hypothetical protein